MDTVKSAELRRSCVFCRQRKMRCSGDLPCCTTCRQREKPCVYEPVAFKGRYKLSESNEDASAANVELGQASVNGGDELSLGQSFYGNIPVGEELTFFFGAFCAALHSSHIYSSGVEKKNLAPPLTYTAALPTVTRDLVEMTARKINGANGQVATSTTYGRSLWTDSASSVLDGLDFPEAEQWFAINGPPSSAQTEQMLELAFNHHPLVALIVPKTPFIRNHHEGAPNHCLLWLLCGEGLELGVPPGMPSAPTTYNLPSPHAFIQLAWKSLFSARQATRSDGIWTSQALLLLGFRLLCQGRAKQATCFLLLCARSVACLLTDRTRLPPTEVKINGIRMSEVDDQAIHNMFWIAHCLLLWMWSQLNNSETELARFIYPDPPTTVPVPTTILCVNALYKLDYVSGNFTSLNMQISNNRSLTTLSHICSMVHSLTNGGGEAWQSTSTMYAAMSAKLLYQTKHLLSASLIPTADEHANKTIMAAAFLFAISLCEPNSNDQPFSHDIANRRRAALDIAKGMLRDCRLDSTCLATHESAVIRQIFMLAHNMLARILANRPEVEGFSLSDSAQQSSLNSTDNCVSGNWLQEDSSVLQEFSKAAGLDMLSICDSALNPTLSDNTGPTLRAPVAIRPAVTAHHSTPNLQQTTLRDSSSNWQQSDTIPTAFRARSFSDSAAIYCPASSNTLGMPFFTSHTTSSYVHASPPFNFATAYGMQSGVSGGGGGSSTFDTSASFSSRRTRTPSLEGPDNDSSVRSSTYVPSPPQSAPPSDLALLSETSSALQSVLQGYNISATGTTAHSESMLRATIFSNMTPGATIEHVKTSLKH